MIDMRPKYDNMYKNGMFYALIYNDNHIIKFINCMLSAPLEPPTWQPHPHGNRPNKKPYVSKNVLEGVLEAIQVSNL